MKKQKLVPKQIEISYNKAADNEEEDKFKNKAHNTETRFFIFILNGEHFYDWFLQKSTTSVLFEFIYNKLKEKDGETILENGIKVKNLKKENIHIYKGPSAKEEFEEIECDDSITINNEIRGTTSGRSTLYVRLSDA